MQKKHWHWALLGLGAAALALPSFNPAQAGVTGLNASEVEVIVDAKPEDAEEWIEEALVKETDEDGVLKLKGTLPGCYKLSVDEDDQKENQYLGARMRMLNHHGQVADDTEVDIYLQDSEGNETYSGLTLETDEEGWIEMGDLDTMVFLVPDQIYCLDIDKDHSNPSSRADNRIPVKIEAKVKSEEGENEDDREGEYTDWFRCLYKSTKVDQGVHFLNVESLFPGKYIISYPKEDSPQNQTILMRTTVINAQGEPAEDETVKIYAYLPTGQRVMVGQVKTDDEGDVLIPTLPGKYKIKL
jgi:hypothetical protein